MSYSGTERRKRGRKPKAEADRLVPATGWLAQDEHRELTRRSLRGDLGVSALVREAVRRFLHFPTD